MEFSFVGQYKKFMESENERELTCMKYDIEFVKKDFVPNMKYYKLECEERFLKNQYSKLLRLQSQNKIYDNKYMEKELTKIMSKCEELKNFFLITINPKPDTDFDDFRNLVFSIKSWRPMISGMIFFEQRGENESEIGKGFHAHIIVDKHNYEYNKLRTQLEGKFKSVCDKTKNEDGKWTFQNTINIKNKLRMHWKETVEEYLIEQSKDTEKLDKVWIDKLWRGNNKIKDKYTWGMKGDTTDETPSITVRDGRVSNGGKREGSGRKKKELTNLQIAEIVEISQKSSIIEF